MGDPNLKRSQAILRMPVDMVDAVMILHDGDRSDVLLFVPPTEDVSRVLSEGRPFLPVMREASTCLVARDAIACLGVERSRVSDLGDMPTVEQVAKVTLRSGTVLDGTLRWVAPDGMMRTADYLNDDDISLIVLHAADRSWLIAKSHVAMVREV